MKREPSALIAWLLLAFASFAIAAIHVTESPGPHELRARDGTVLNRYESHEACVAAAAITPGQYRCVNSVLVSVVGVCDTPAPAPVVDAAGFTFVGNLEGHLCAGSDTRYWFTETRTVPTDYHVCWQTEPVAISDCSTPAAVAAR